VDQSLPDAGERAPPAHPGMTHLPVRRQIHGSTLDALRRRDARSRGRPRAARPPRRTSWACDDLVHGTAPSEPVELEQPRLRGTMVGSDEDSGAVRMRVSIKESISCRSTRARSRCCRSGATSRPPRSSAPPPPPAPVSPHARAAPGRSSSAAAAAPPAPSRPPSKASWRLTNGLEAVTPHIHFQWTTRRGDEG